MGHPVDYVPDVVYYANQRNADFNSPKTPKKKEEKTTKEEGYVQNISSESEEHDVCENVEKMFDPVRSPRKFAVTGLRNLGNSCYMNAVVQNLKNLPNFLQEITQNNPEQTRGGVTAEIIELIRRMQTEQYKMVSPTSLRKAVKDSIPLFNDGKQQDAQEFVTWLLETIEKEKTTKDECRGMLYGMYENVLECMKCKRRTEKQEEFNCLRVAIPQKSSKVTLADCLKLWQNTEEIERDCCRCECTEEICKCDLENKCRAVKAKKTLKIKRYPNVLMIQIKRFEEGKKNNKHVDVPMKLNQDNNIYNLVGTVEHSGAPNGGHYKAKCWNEKRNRWYLMDDGNVEPIKPSATNTEKAYLLFYARRTREDKKVPEEAECTQRRSNRQSFKSEKAKALEQEEEEKLKNKLDGESKKKQKKNVETETPTEETEEKKYCTCNRPYDEEIHECMMSCDRCEEWYHCDCIEFTCMKCDIKDNAKCFEELKLLKTTLEEKKTEIVKLKNEIKSKKMEKSSQEDQDLYRLLEKKHEGTIARLKIAEKENTKLRKEVEKNKEEMKNMREQLPSKEPNEEERGDTNGSETGSHQCESKDDNSNEQDDKDGEKEEIEKTNSEESDLKKENRKMKLLIKKKDRLIAELQGDKQKAVVANLEATRTIRNLNNNIDRLMKEAGEKRKEVVRNKKNDEATEKKDSVRAQENSEIKGKNMSSGSRKDSDNMAKEKQIKDHLKKKGEDKNNQSRNNQAIDKMQNQFYLDEAKVCQHYLDGYCRYGASCHDIHDKGNNETITKTDSMKSKKNLTRNEPRDRKYGERCWYFMNGFCRYGKSCWDVHERGVDKKNEEKEKMIENRHTNNRRLKDRELKNQEETFKPKPCHYFIRGNCQFGDNCWNHHPEKNGVLHETNHQHQTRKADGKRYSKQDYQKKTEVGDNELRDKVAFLEESLKKISRQMRK